MYVHQWPSLGHLTFADEGGRLCHGGVPRQPVLRGALTPKSPPGGAGPAWTAQDAGLTHSPRPGQHPESWPSRRSARQPRLALPVASKASGRASCLRHRLPPAAPHPCAGPSPCSGLPQETARTGPDNTRGTPATGQAIVVGTRRTWGCRTRAPRIWGSQAVREPTAN